MTPIMLASAMIKWAVVALAWLRGGHTERLAAVIVLLDHAVTRVTTRLPGGDVLSVTSECVVAAFFVWLALRSNRWWILVATAALVLCVLVIILDWTHPGVSRNTAISARIGLWWVINLSLLAGVWERWLAGEPAVSARRAWRRAGVDQAREMGRPTNPDGRPSERRSRYAQ